MKKIAPLLAFLLLCVTGSFAQKTMDTKNGDYAHHRYFAAVVAETQGETHPPQQASAAESQPDVTVRELQQSLSALRWMVYALIAFVVLIVAACAVYVKKQFDVKNRNGALAELIKRVLLREGRSGTAASNDGDVSMFEDKLNKLERDMGNMRKQMGKMAPTAGLKSRENQPAEAAPSTLFFRTKNGKILQDELADEAGAAFKVFNINGNEADFLYCGSGRNHDSLTDVCRFANNPEEIQTIRAIKTTTVGKVKKENENWVVSNLATIQFI